MLGNLYIIRNTVNDKVYIGKTYKTIEWRFKEHIRQAKNKSKTPYKLQKAILKYGADKFYIELIDKFEAGILEEKEIEYIAKYDSYHNGYNSTLGGDTGKRLEVDESAMLIDWRDGLSINKLSKKYKISADSVSKILVNNNVYEKPAPDEPISVIVYDKYWNRIKKLDSRKKTVDFIENELKMTVPFSVCQRLDEACISGRIAFNCRWQKPEDLIFDDKEFNRIYDKERYISGFKCVEIDGLWFSEEQEGNTYLDVDSGKIHKIEVIKKEIIIICPEKSILEELVLSLSNLEIAIKYNVTESTVRKWLQKYNIDSKFKIKQKEIREKTIILYNEGKTLTEISKELNITKDTVNKIFAENNIVYTKTLIGTHIGKYDKLTGELLGEFDTYNAAWKSCGEKDFADKIRLCVEGKRKSAGGYIWKKIE